MVFPMISRPYTKQSKAVLDSQLSVVEGTQAHVIMIPGNHDWNNGARDGYETIIREQVYVDLLNKPNVQFLSQRWLSRTCRSKSWK